MIQIRQMTDGDMASILQINSECQPNVALLDGIELQRLQALSSHHLVAESRQAGVLAYLLAFAGENPYDGEEFLHFRAEQSHSFLYIDQIAVSSRAKGQGIGASLYRAVEQLAAKTALGSLCCEINIIPPNPDSIAFHQKMGFQAVGVMDTLDGRKVGLYRKGLQPCRSG